MIEPLENRIIIRPDEASEVTQSGLYIPDTAKEKPNHGVVVAVGEGTYASTGVLIPMKVKVGDMVLYGQWSGTDIQLEGVNYLIMREGDAIAVTG